MPIRRCVSIVPKQLVQKPYHVGLGFRMPAVDTPREATAAPLFKRLEIGLLEFGGNLYDLWMAEIPRTHVEASRKRLVAEHRQAGARFGGPPVRRSASEPSGRTR